MRKNHVILHAAPVIILGLLFFSCSKETEQQKESAPTISPDARIVATVDGDPITLGEFLERFQRAGFQPEPEASSEVKTAFLNRLIERKMMLRAAQRKRIKIRLRELNNRIAALRAEYGKDVKEALREQGVDYEKWKADLWENIMIETLIEREVDRRVTVSDAAVKRYYNAHRNEFEKPEQARARQIVVTTESEAQNIIEILEEGNVKFSALAKEKSIAPESKKGGDLGYFARGEMPVEFNIVFDLKPGETSGVVKSPYGFHVFKLVDKRPAGKRSLQAVYSEIKDALYEEKREQRYRRWLKQLRSSTKFEVNYQALDE